MKRKTELDTAVADMIANRLADAGVIDGAAPGSFPDARTFCPLPWMRASVMPTGKVVPCCYAEGEGFADLRGATLKEAWNSPAIRRMRLNMLKGAPSPECALCYEREKQGLRSHRQVALDAHPPSLPSIARTARDGAVEPAEPVFLELRFSNVCNLRCRTCGPHFSSAWHEDARRLGDGGLASKIISPSGGPRAVLEQIESVLPGVAQIRFAGGEPLLMDEHYDLLELLIREKRTDVALSYHTNLSVLSHRGRDAARAWARFDNVLVRGSLDAAGARGEYIRKGLDWDAAVRNRGRMLDVCPEARFCLFPTVSILNVLAILDLHRVWRNTVGFAGDETQLNVLTWPRHYSVQALPEPFKRVVRERYERYIRDELRPLGEPGRKMAGELRAVLAHMTKRDESRLLPKFLSLTERLDALRGEDFAEVFPELNALRLTQ